MFRGEGESASTTDRAGFQALLEFVTTKKNRVRYVVVYDVTRFSRDMADFFTVRKTLEKYGVSLRSATQPIDETSTGTLMAGVLASMAQFDNDLRRDKTVAGMKAALEGGHWPWKPPNGYRAIGMSGSGVIEPIPEVAPLIARAFEMVASGTYTSEEAREHVGSLGLKGKSGTRIDRQSFHSMLRNVFYIGVVHSPKWGITRRGLHTPIVASEVFHRAQDRLEGRTVSRRQRRRQRVEFPLKGNVLCSACSRPLTASFSTNRSGAKYGYYFCPSCPKVSIRDVELHRLFKALLSDLQPDAGRVHMLLNALRTAWSEKHANIVKSRRAGSREIEELRKKRAKLVDLIADGKLSPDSVRDNIEKIDIEIYGRQATLDAEIDGDLDFDGALWFADQVLEDLAGSWDSLELNGKVGLLAVLFPEKLTFSGKELGTGAISPLFKMFRKENFAEGRLASPTGFEPVLAP